jgi:hypothetical protein
MAAHHLRDETLGVTDSDVQDSTTVTGHDTQSIRLSFHLNRCLVLVMYAPSFVLITQRQCVAGTQCSDWSETPASDLKLQCVCIKVSSDLRAVSSGNWKYNVFLIVSMCLHNPEIEPNTVHQQLPSYWSSRLDCG